MTGTKSLSRSDDLPTPNFAVGLDVGNDILSPQTSICMDYWFFLTVRMVVLLSELNEALESQGPFTNIARHMAHKF